jgi:hypothetical protein
LAIPLRIVLFGIYELNSRLIDPVIATSTFLGLLLIRETKDDDLTVSPS